MEALTKRPDIAAREENGEGWYREVDVVYLYNWMCRPQTGRGVVVVVVAAVMVL